MIHCPRCKTTHGWDEDLGTCTACGYGFQKVSKEAAELDTKTRVHRIKKDLWAQNHYLKLQQLYELVAASEGHMTYVEAKEAGGLKLQPVEGGKEKLMARAQSMGIEPKAAEAAAALIYENAEKDENNNAVKSKHVLTYNSKGTLS